MNKQPFFQSAQHWQAEPDHPMAVKPHGRKKQPKRLAFGKFRMILVLSGIKWNTSRARRF